ncbi:hypothetical protein OIV83_000808 [Microbotryomycetes sp. JL201]|nr:hypothetical protein OIV83_000808 [Microbotryomycetes sp. JL201]
MVAPARWGGHCFPIILTLILISSLLALFSWQDPVAIAQHEHQVQLSEHSSPSSHVGLADLGNQTPSCAVDENIVKQYGNINIRLSRTHEGSRHRLAKVIQRAQRGDKLNVAVLGGSVSTGHGFADGKPFQYGAIKETWQTFVVQALKDMFGEEAINFSDGARPAVDSAFFRYCFPALIGTRADLIFVEMAVNDVYSTESLDHAEELLRALLQLPNEPAVVFVEAFALRTKSGRDGMLNGADSHASLAEFYDVPSVSLRAPVLSTLLQDESLAEPYFKTDVRHISAPLHEFLGKMVVAFLQDTRCRLQDFLLPVEASESEFAQRTESALGKVPPIKVSDDWNEQDRSYASVPPTCHLAGETLEPSLPSPKWSLYVWKDAKRYLETKERNSEIAFQVETRKGGKGTIVVSYLKSKEYDLGKLVCRVGDQKVTIDGYWSKRVSIAQTAVVATDLEPGGTYEMRCKTPLKPGPGGRIAFRLMGVMSL